MNQAQHRLALPEGSSLHWYRVIRVLGKGGFGITYLAQDTNLDKPVAIKEFLPTEFATRDADLTVHPDSLQHQELYQWGLTRFIEEARLLSRFEHPNIVRVHTVFEENNTGYMVMAYEQGRSLKAILTEQSTLDEATLLGLLMPILDGLEQVHQKQFIHRDIKPDNLYVREDGSPVLLDFGSARQSVPGESRTLTTMVSPGFAPFEQYHPKGEDQGPWTDIYSLGATLYRAISGVNPVDAVTRSHALLGGKPDPLPLLQATNHPGYSAALLAAVNHALCFQSADRPLSIELWRQELLAADATVVVRPSATTRVVASNPSFNTPANTSGNTPAAPKSKGAGALVLGGALVVLLLAGLGYGWMLTQEVASDSDQRGAPEALASVDRPADEVEQQLELARAEQERIQQEQLLQEQQVRAQQELARQQAEVEAKARALAAQEAARKEAATRELDRQRQAALQQEQEKRIAASTAQIAQRRAKKKDVYSFAEWPQPKPYQQPLTFNVAAVDKQWSSAGIQLQRGERYRIEASGQWKLGGLCKATDATGVGMYSLACWDGGGQTVAGYPHGALIAKIGKDSLAFYVGSEFDFTAPEDGPLFLMVNEAAPYFSDNTGALTVTVTRQP